MRKKIKIFFIGFVFGAVIMVVGLLTGMRGRKLESPVDFKEIADFSGDILIMALAVGFGSLAVDNLNEN